MTWDDILQLQPVTLREVQIFKQLPKNKFYDEAWYVEEYRNSLIIIKNHINIEIIKEDIINIEQLKFSLRWPKKKPNEYKFSWIPSSKNKTRFYNQYKNKILNDIFDSIHLNVFEGE